MSHALKATQIPVRLRFQLVPSASATPFDDAGFDLQSNSVYQGGALSELERAVAEASRPNWDGRGSPPVDSMTEKFAREFILAIPSGFPEPEVFVDSDGDVRMEWFEDADWTFEVSVNGRGGVSYARRFGGSRQHGSVMFRGWWPVDLQENLIRFASR